MDGAALVSSGGSGTGGGAACGTGDGADGVDEEARPPQPAGTSAIKRTITVSVRVDGLVTVPPWTKIAAEQTRVSGDVQEVRGFCPRGRALKIRFGPLARHLDPDSLSTRQRQTRATL